MNQFIQRKPVLTIYQDEPKSVLDMTEDELNKIDRFQTINRGFRDEDRGIPCENIEIYEN